MKFFLGALAVAFAAYIVVSTSGAGGSDRSGAAATATHTVAPATVTTTTTAPPQKPEPPQCPAAVNVGSTRPELVRGVQRALTQAGHSLVVDGVYGPDTLQAVRAVKSDIADELPDDGLVNDPVWRALGKC